MFHPARSLRPAAALVAAALIVLTAAFLGAACGGSDDDAGSATPSASSGSPGQSSSGTAGTTIDLAEDGGLTTYSGQDATDLVNVSSSLALGDFNDDGEMDALIGAPQADGPDDEREDAGEAYIVFGPLDESRSLGAGSADVTIFGAGAGDGLGFTALAGDLNDDGVDDVLVGAPGVTAGFDLRSDQGRVYVFYGNDDFGDEQERDLAEDVFDFTVTGAEGFSRLGHAMDLGDVNGDGIQDLVVGAPFAGRKPGTAPGGERTALGEVYVVFGADDLSGEKNIARDEFDVLLSGAIPFAQFGASVSVGDVNGDGTEDIVSGAYRASTDAASATTGLVYVFYGRSDFEDRLTAESDDQNVTITGPAGSSLGFPLVTGDFNGDEVDDMAFGAQLQTSGLLDRQGALRVIYGSEDLAPEIDAAEAAAITITGSITGELFPTSLAAADIDGDGTADLIAGSSLAGPADDRPGAGLVHVFTRIGSLAGKIDLSEGAAPLTLYGAVADDRLGSAVAGGELTDEARGLLVLAAMADTGNDSNDQGVVYVIPVSE